jgi:hypothetical protein
MAFTFTIIAAVVTDMLDRFQWCRLQARSAIAKIT